MSSVIWNSDLPKVINADNMHHLNLIACPEFYLFPEKMCDIHQQFTWKVKELQQKLPEIPPRTCLSLALFVMIYVI